MGKITIEGIAQFSGPAVNCVCAFCGENAESNAMVVFDFKQQKILYLCGNPKCKKMNELNLRIETGVPYPKMRTSR